MKYLTIALLFASLFPVSAKADEDIVAAKEVTNLLQSHDVGMVATITKEKDLIKPYASVIPFILHEGAPVIFISDLAVHTDNINNNPYASIMVFVPDKNGNVFAGSRVTVTGKMKKVTVDESIAQLRKKYLNQHPESAQFIDFGDFNYYIMHIDEIYYIGGFGKIGYIDVKKYNELNSARTNAD